MKKYLIQRNQGEYVTPPGSLRSYTRSLERARLFTLEEARNEKCDNESIVDLYDLIPSLSI